MWMTPLIATSLPNSVSNLNNNNFFDCLKKELSHKEEFDTIIGLGGAFCGRFEVQSGGVTTIKKLSANEIEVDLDFTYTSVNRSDNSFVGDTTKRCRVKLQIDPIQQSLTFFTFPNIEII
ncbi:hypothetical protein [Methylophilus sp. Leaf408]|uniref:hypothetical protein n=1 Tax=Methylophilus sp. Leaf408 TaxID=2876561 RepID=UPI001E5FC2D6|nr:hypothetical protein [Methylophilus sp. Leaf408]